MRAMGYKDNLVHAARRTERGTIAAICGARKAVTGGLLEYSGWADVSCPRCRQRAS